MKNQELSLKELAERLDGNYWEKGTFQRIYLDAGHNTKKMSTKTFIWQDEEGDFKVSCKIQCSSQPYEWINSQENQVKKGIYKMIEDATATEYHFAKKKGAELYFSYKGLTDYNAVIDGELYPTEERLLAEMDNCGDVPEHFDFLTIPREEVEAKIEEYEKLREKQREEKAEVEAKAEAKTEAKIPSTPPSPLREFTIGAIYTNPTFGKCLIEKQDETYVFIKLEETGEKKKLLRRFAKLEK